VTMGEVKPVSTPVPVLDADTAYHLTLCARDSQERPPRTVCSKPTDFRTRPAGGRSGIAFARGGDIWLMDANGGNQSRLVDTDGANYLTWSPDATKLAYAEGSEIWRTNADGTNKIRLTYNSGGDYAPAWSPDGTKIAWLSSNADFQAVWVMGADGSNPTRLSYDVNGGQLVTWSPDGSKLAYTGYTDGLEQIVVMNADGSNPHQITHESHHASQPAWSPDGTQIAYKHDSQIWVMESDGSYQFQRSTSTSDDFPTWSPDGSKIAFRTGRQALGVEVWRMDAGGSNQIDLSGAPPNTDWYDTAPVWSPRP
jgi:Tol biopolymer transport system component